jgi:UDP-N-acetylglucosamine enolpyruvyl transferase
MNKETIKVEEVAARALEAATKKLAAAGVEVSEANLKCLELGCLAGVSQVFDEVKVWTARN